MKTVKNLLIASAVLLLTFGSCTNKKLAEGTTRGQIDSVSYAMGVNFGQSLKQANMDVLDLDVLMGAVQDVFNGKKLRIEDKEVDGIIRSFMANRREFVAKKNLEEGLKFLADNRKNADIIELTNGLQYKIITQGSGIKPNAEDTVKVNYRGTLIDGSEFDASDDPVTFPLNGVIVGWTEGLQELNVGTKAMLYIPTELAYGERGQRMIAPNSVLIFEVELLEVKQAQPTTEK